MVIQRSWKILSDTGSATSASSTEANRSPPGLLNSSSDDSNCSNQTTHSMVTSVASPPGNITSAKTELSHSNATTASNNNNSNNTTEMIKFLTTPQIAENTLQKLRQRYGCCPTNNSTTSSESAMRSLELVRIAIQSSFDQEINDLIKKFIESYFKPAFKNIKENLGQNAVHEDVFQKMSCALLENAKSQYKIYKGKNQSLNTLTNNQVGQQESALRMAIKRPAPTPTKPIITSSDMQKRFLTDNIIIQQQQAQQHQGQLQHQAQQYQTLEQIITTATSIAASTNLTTTSNALVTYSNVNQLINATTAATTLPTAAVATAATVTIQPPRRQIYWNTAHISTSTKFVLDVQANQAFGFASDGKERLASKHPELIRYLPDNEDRNWLVSQQIIPQQNRTSRFLFLIYDEIHRLYQTHEIYRNKSNVDLSLMMTFTLADFIIQKMKIFFVDLNIKSRGLITNSYSISGSDNNTTNNNNNNNNSNNSNNCNINNNTTILVQSNSHLRNALLQGTQSTSATHITSIQNSSAMDNTITVMNINNSQNNNNAAADSTVSQKPKSSALSSSHATLTALLNNSISNVDKSSTSTTNNVHQSTNQLNRK